MRIFGIDPGSERTGYGCVETDGRRHHLVACGAITASAGDGFPQRLERIHRELARLLAACSPDAVAIENLFHAKNARSALKLGHARGVAILAAVQAGCTIAEYTPAEVKRSVVGYGRAEKPQVQQMVKVLLGLEKAPTPFDASDALAVAICHLHSMPPVGRLKAAPTPEGGRETAARRTDRVRLKAAPPADGRRENGEPPPTIAAGLARAGRKLPRTWRHYRPPTTG